MPAAAEKSIQTAMSMFPLIIIIIITTSYVPISSEIELIGEIKPRH